jgi:hypothetical protein
MPGVGAFEGTRIVGKLGLTTTVLARLSVGFGFTLRHDQKPPRSDPDRHAGGSGLRPGVRAVLRQGRYGRHGDAHLPLHLRPCT